MASHGQHKKPVSREKAKEIMRHGEVRGKVLTRKQRGLFGMIAGGGMPTRMKGKTMSSHERRAAARSKAHGG